MKSQHRMFLPILLMILFVAGCAAESDFDEYCSPTTADYTGSPEADLVGRYWKHCPPTYDGEETYVCYLRPDGYYDRWAFEDGDLAGVTIGDRDYAYGSATYEVDDESITFDGSEFAYTQTEEGLKIGDGFYSEPLACAGLPDSVD